MPEQRASQEIVLQIVLDAALTGAAGKPWQQFCLPAHCWCAYTLRHTGRVLIRYILYQEKRPQASIENATCAPCARI